MKSFSGQGFTLIETLVAAFLLTVGVVAITGLIMLGSRLSFESERQVVAQGIINQKMEIIRSLNYADIGVNFGGYHGGSTVLTKEETITRNDQNYTVEQAIRRGDDASNGSTPNITEANSDYKVVTVTAKWTAAGGRERSVSTSAVFTPSSNLRSCTPGQTSCPGLDGALTEVCPSSGLCSAIQECTPGSMTCFNNTVRCPDSGRCPKSLPDTSGLCPAEALFCGT